MADIRTTTITSLNATIAALSADILANPVPASPVVVATAPIFVPVGFNATALNDYFGMAKAGAIITYMPTSVDYQPPAGPSKTANGTSSVLLNTPNVKAQNFKMRLALNTEKQLRTSGAPNSWECAWVFFNFHMGSDGLPAYNYMAFKPTGLEIGTGFSGLGQTYLYTSSTPTFPIGKTATIEIDKQGRIFSVIVNGALVLNQVTFPGAYDVSGEFALYCEDSQVLCTQFDVMVLN